MTISYKAKENFIRDFTLQHPACTDTELEHAVAQRDEFWRLFESELPYLIQAVEIYDDQIAMGQYTAWLRFKLCMSDKLWTCDDDVFCVRHFDARGDYAAYWAFKNQRDEIEFNLFPHSDGAVEMMNAYLKRHRDWLVNTCRAFANGVDVDWFKREYAHLERAKRDLLIERRVFLRAMFYRDFPKFATREQLLVNQVKDNHAHRVIMLSEELVNDIQLTYKYQHIWIVEFIDLATFTVIERAELTNYYDAQLAKLINDMREQFHKQVREILNNSPSV